MTPETRFWRKVNRDGPPPEHRPDLGPCWLWTASLDRWGYGQVRWDGTIRRAHRVAWAIVRGEPVPPELDHLCRVRRCVRPDHLDGVTRRENQHRGAGFAPVNASKTHCPAGHAYTPENTYHRPDRVGRHCRECKREADRRRYRRSRR